MAEQVAIDLTIKTGEAEKNAQSLKSKLRELKDQLATLDEGSQEFQQMAQEAGKLEDKIGDVNARVKALASDTGGLDAFASVAQGIAGGFAAWQGATALLGVENEELNKKLLKVQGSVALLNGVQQVANTLNKDSAASIKILGFVQARYTAVVEGTTGALKLMRIAGAALGIGLLITGIGLLIANFDKIVEAVKNVINRFEFLQKTIKVLGDAWDFVLEKGREYLSQLGLMDSAQEKLLKDSIEREKVALENLIKAKESEIKIRQAKGEDVHKLEEELYDRRLRLAELKGEDETDIIVAELKRQEKIREDAAKAALEAEEKRRKLAEEFKKTFKEDVEAEPEIDLGLIKKQEISDKELEIKRKQAEEERKIRDELNQVLIDAEHKRIQAEDAANKAAQLQKQQDTLAIAQASFGALSALNNLLTTNESNNRNRNAKEELALKKKQFERGKALAIVNTVINTAQAIMAQLTAGPPVGIALAALAGVTGALQVAAISSQKFDGGGAGVSQIGSVGSVDGPSATNQAPGVPQTPQSIPIPQQVYVTETDISGVQGQVNVIEGLSKIG
jgi:hypothetical protein